MAKLKLANLKFIYQKGRKQSRKLFELLPFLLFVICCSSPDLSNYGRITANNTSNKNSFIFSVSDDFLSANPKSAQDKKFAKMTESEVGLLKSLLKQKKYCLNKSGDPFFVITSRQEKIYDMTFAHLIEENYKARPIVPRMYFGQCVK